MNDLYNIPFASTATICLAIASILLLLLPFSFWLLWQKPHKAKVKIRKLYTCFLTKRMQDSPVKTWPPVAGTFRGRQPCGDLGPYEREQQGFLPRQHGAAIPWQVGVNSYSNSLN